MSKPIMRVLRLRIRDKHSEHLCSLARKVNFVWNFCEETQRHALKWDKKWPSGFDLQKLTSGSSKELGLRADTINKVCERYAASRKQAKRRSLRWRGKRSLGWIPIKDGCVRFDGDAFVYADKRYCAWLSYPLKPGQTFGLSSFSQDARGRWYINLLTEAPASASPGQSAVGVDLGLKDIAALSTGRKIEHPRWYRRIEQRLAIVQRAKKTKQAKTLNAKAANQRADFLHKESLRLVREHGAIFVGNVNPTAMVKSGRAKSVLDAGWAEFKRQLSYKANAHGVVFAEVNEAYSTQTCSQCGSVEGPKGVAGLGIRQWRCSCGVDHDRDTNAAKNIARRGLATLAEGAAS